MSYQAETAVIGSLLVDINSLGNIYGLLEPDMFESEVCGALFYRLREMYNKGESVDLIILQDRITDIPWQLTNACLQDCLGSTGVSTNIGGYAKIVLNDYKAREVGKLLNNTELDGNKIDSQIQELSAVIEKIQATAKDGSQTIADVVDGYSGELFTDKRQQGIALGFPKLDDKLQNLDRGDLCIIAARPSVGKSAFSTQIAMNMAKAGHKVGLFNLEMENEQVYDRILAFESGIELKRIRRALSFVGDEKEKFDSVNSLLRELGDRIILVDDMYKVSEMQSLAKRTDMDVVIIDYAQLITPESNYRGNRYAEVGAISHSIKKMAKTLKIPVILLAQLNRRSEMNSTKEPTMAELREAGDFEQDASQIILLWNETEDRKTKGVKIDKNRQGETGKVVMDFDGRMMRFTESTQPGFNPVFNEDTPWG